MMSMPKTAETEKRVAVIGGGAAGLMAAGCLGEMGVRVTLYERGARLGQKLRITGKGRCNLTNNCDIPEFIAHVPTNPRFLYTALSRFSPADCMSFFEALGVPLKTERGRRVFPVSDKATDVVEALSHYALRHRCVRLVRERVRSLEVEEGRIASVTAENTEKVDAVLVCTGGCSYPRTGSDGDGYRLARAAGHTITPLTPSLVALVAAGDLCGRMQGLSLKNVSCRFVLRPSGRVIYEDFGEMLFTHNGVSGPMILSGSAHLKGVNIADCELYLDLKPALDEATLDHRLLSDFEKYRNRDLANAMCDLLPAKMILPLIGQTGIPETKKANSITREERHTILATLKGFRIPLLKFGPLEEAIVTSGGVDVREVSPRTMESRLVSGLYFAGEVLDVDAYTGGYNLQIAFSTARLAAESAADGLLKTE